MKSRAVDHGWHCPFWQSKVQLHNCKPSRLHVNFWAPTQQLPYFVVSPLTTCLLNSVNFVYYILNYN